MSGLLSKIPPISRGRIGVALVLLTVCFVWGYLFPVRFFEGYLIAYVFWVQISLGCLFLLFLQYLTGGRWGIVILRLLEAGMMNLPLCALLFLPILVGLPYLFSWTHPLGGELGHLVRQKEAYLNVPFYLIRSLLYFLTLGALSAFYRRQSLRREYSVARARLQRWSGPCLIVFVLLMNFACIDWVMSLNPEWYSSMFVVEFVSEQAVVALAGVLLILRCVAHCEPWKRVLTVKVVHDLGNLLLAFTCFWAYVTFSEYLIIWTGNLPHDSVWFSDRSSFGWKMVAVLLVLVHFFIPLFCLILTSISKNLERLAWVAALLIVAHFVQIIWWIEPVSGRDFHFPWVGSVLMVGMGGVWLAGFWRNLAAAPLLVEEDLSFHAEEVR